MYLDPNDYQQGDLVLITDPATKVVTVDEIKDHLRIDTTDEDTLLGLYIDAATEMAENYCGRHFIEHTYKLYFDTETHRASLYFPDCTLVSSDAVLTKYVEWKVTDWETTFYSDDAYLESFSNPSIVRLSKGFGSFGYPANGDGDLFWFNFKTGFGAAASDVPQAIKQAIKLIVADMYYFREDRKRSFPMASEILLQPYKCYQ